VNIGASGKTGTARIGAIKRASRMRVMVDAYRQIGMVTTCCRIAGISRKTHYDWLKSSTEYREAFTEARELFADALEREARRRAMEGVAVPVIYNGRRVGTTIKYSDRLLALLLEGAWRERAARSR